MLRSSIVQVVPKKRSSIAQILLKSCPSIAQVALKSSSAQVLPKEQKGAKRIRTIRSKKEHIMKKNSKSISDKTSEGVLTKHLYDKMSADRAKEHNFQYEGVLL